jgi:RNA polymerase sigma-B factor
LNSSPPISARSSPRLDSHNEVKAVTPSTAAVPDQDRSTLIASHEGLARSLARRFANRGEDLDDLVQVAFIGLIKAADRFDADRNIRFSTFATATIVGELKRHFRDKRWAVHVSRSVQERYLLIRQATEWARADLGRSPTVAEIAAAAAVTEEQVLEAQELIGAFRLDSIDGQSEDGTGSPLQPASIDPGYNTVENRSTLQLLTRRLCERDRTIVRLRFVDELTQSEIADRLELSQMQVSRLLARILASLREWAAFGDRGAGAGYSV